MMDWKKRLVGGALAGLTLCTVVMLLPGSAAGCCTEPQVETWVETAAAIVKTNQGDCANQPGTRCHELCVSFNGGPPVPSDYFQCR